MRWLCLVFLVLLLGLVSMADSTRDKLASLDEKLLTDQGVPTEGPALLDYVRKRLTLTVSDAEIRRLVEQLGDDTFAVREQAFRRLSELGTAARRFLQDAEKHDDLEIRTRVARLLRMLDENCLSRQTLAAAIRQLGRRKPAGSAALLLERLPSVEVGLATEIRDTLSALALSNGKAEPAVLAALKDTDPSRREAAGVALARVRLAEHLPALRALLNDRDRQVRFSMALALVKQREREAVKVLLEIMEFPNSPSFSEAEEILFTLAGTASPRLTGEDEAACKRYREAWQAWWKEAAGRVDLAQLDPPTKPPENTLIVLLDANQVLSLDRENKVRWQFTGVQQVLDIQALPGDRVLLAEYRANRVTERDSKGKILWEHRFEEPLMAQRLTNGNTLIASASNLVEIDPSGKAVFQYAPLGSQIMRARKVPGGDIVMITQLGVTHCVRINRFGREVRKFGVYVGTSGGRLDVTAAGNVLIPEKDANRICEFDPSGQIVRTVQAMQPIAAVFQPGGNVLYTSMSELRAVEVDPQGKEVWEYRRDTKVSRAIRH